MKKQKESFSKRLLCLSLILAILLLIPCGLLAHSGRTDSQGGHRDNNNVSGLGSYHFHHGYGPHLHENGICPYENVGSSTQTRASTPKTSASSNAAETVRQRNSSSDDYFAVAFLSPIVLVALFFIVIKQEKNSELKRIREEELKKQIDALIPEGYCLDDLGRPVLKGTLDPGKYSTYITKSGGCYHTKNCKTKGLYLANVVDVVGKKKACSKCNPSLPDRSWYYEIQKIKREPYV